MFSNLRCKSLGVFFMFSLVTACGEDAALKLGSSEQGRSTVGARAPEDYRSYENVDVDRSRKGTGGRIYSTGDQPDTTASDFESEHNSMTASTPEEGSDTEDSISSSFASLGEKSSGTLTQLQSADAVAAQGRSSSGSLAAVTNAYELGGKADELNTVQAKAAPSHLSEVGQSKADLSASSLSESGAIGQSGAVASQTPAPSTQVVAAAPTAATSPTPTPSSSSIAEQVETVDDVVYTCASSAKKTRTVQVIFEEKNQTCAFSQGGNLSKVDGKVRARAETYKYIPVSDHEVICDVKLSSPTQSVKFDDEIFVTFNDIILLSSYNYNSRFNLIDLDYSVPAYKYDWSKLVGGFNPGASNADGGYCLGEENSGTSCSIPVTERVGAFSLKLGEQESALLSLSTIQKKQAKLGFVITGDNDSSDCKHSRIVFDVQVTSVGN